MSTLQHVTGMPDRFEDELVAWRHLEQLAKDTFIAYGFGEIRTPLVEPLELFVRGVGEATDMVGKEMFGVTDRESATPLCLRPENTAGAVRAMIQAGKIFADAFHKAFYVGPQFRNERAQAGRFKQFHQLGAEALGYSDAAADVEMIALVHTLLSKLGIADAKLHLNTLGDATDRPKYRDALVAYFTPHVDKLSADSRDRLAKNPLRILDSKDAGDRALCVNAPKPAQFLSPEAGTHFAAVRSGLEALAIPYLVDDNLVRGLDYYTRTVFEFIGEKGLGAQSTVAAGGRYDGLVAELGGRATPAVGFAAGIERLLLSAAAHGWQAPANVPALALVAFDDAGRMKARELAFALRTRGLRVEVDVQGKSGKSQMKGADKSGARFVIALGGNELTAGTAQLKRMATGESTPVALDVEAIARALA